MRTRLPVLVVLVAGLGGIARPASAQELATTVDQLRVLVKPGDTLTITDEQGQTNRGRLVRLTGTSVEIQADQTLLTFEQDRIRSIAHRRQDSLGNGAKIGFFVGAGLGAFFGAALAGELSAAAVPTIALAYGAMGAGIGTGIDAMRSSNAVIFSRPPGASSAIGVVPDLNARGIRVTLAW